MQFSQCKVEGAFCRVNEIGPGTDGPNTYRTAFTVATEHLAGVMRVSADCHDLVGPTICFANQICESAVAFCDTAE
jgi:hypothetical protein